MFLSYGQVIGIVVGRGCSTLNGVSRSWVKVKTDQGRVITYSWSSDTVPVGWTITT